ncbi:ABC transporter substrate-binding protein [Paraburkholderia caribensis]|uniref:ABC transporter substrate-binding protein n=1 Tax=Paraburkholderia caribensis TaxID=75105 RepID=UPI0015927F7C|nr:ABC transporter substrate-binding protein [Paraburkholderia caribensis]
MIRILMAFVVLLFTINGFVFGAVPVPLKKVRIVVGTTMVNISYPYLNLPLALGYWKEEGYDVELVPLAPPAQSIALLIAGKADFGIVNANVLAKAVTLNDEPVKVAMMTDVVNWKIGVEATSSVGSLKDLKGKTIGTFGLASGGVALLRATLTENGIDPDRDVHIIAVGGGAPAMQALRSREVQALFFWSSAMASFENAGLKMRYLAAEDWTTLPDFGVSVMQSTVASDPKMVLGISRGIAKATLFAFTNPDCVRRIQWKTWPSTKATGSSDDQVLARWDMNTLNGELSPMHTAYDLSGGKYYGAVSRAGYDKLQQYMLKTGQIPKIVPVSQYFVDIPNLQEKINDFQKEPIIHAAQTCVGF